MEKKGWLEKYFGVIYVGTMFLIPNLILLINAWKIWLLLYASMAIAALPGLIVYKIRPNWDIHIIMAYAILMVLAICLGPHFLLPHH